MEPKIYEYKVSFDKAESLIGELKKPGIKEPKLWSEGENGFTVIFPYFATKIFVSPSCGQDSLRLVQIVLEESQFDNQKFAEIFINYLNE